MSGGSRIWLTRPEADSHAIAEALAEHGILSIIDPVITIEPLPVPTLTTPPDALLLTSRHAAHALAPELAMLPVFCVGQATAAIARERGFSEVLTGIGDLMGLLPVVRDRLAPGSQLAYYSGEDIQFDPTSLLAMQGIHCTRHIVYRAAAQGSFTPGLRMHLSSGEIRGVVFFSARTARIACGLLKEEEFTQAAESIDAYCLSLAVSEAASMLPWRSVLVSPAPTRDAMVALVSQHARAIAS